MPREAPKTVAEYQTAAISAPVYKEGAVVTKADGYYRVVTARKRTWNEVSGASPTFPLYACQKVAELDGTRVPSGELKITQIDGWWLELVDLEGLKESVDQALAYIAFIESL
jgi:hypothetical protein